MKQPGNRRRLWFNRYVRDGGPKDDHDSVEGVSIGQGTSAYLMDWDRDYGGRSGELGWALSPDEMRATFRGYPGVAEILLKMDATKRRNLSADGFCALLRRLGYAELKEEDHRAQKWCPTCGSTILRPSRL